MLLKEKNDLSHEIAEKFIFGQSICDRLNDVPTTEIFLKKYGSKKLGGLRSCVKRFKGSMMRP